MMDAEKTPLKSRVSLAQQIVEVLRGEIGVRFKPGERLPGMRLLCRRFGVSINTVGAAIDLLARDGLIIVRQGSGVYVADRCPRRRVGILSELNLFHPGIGRFYPAVADALKARLEERGEEVRLYVGTALGTADESGDSTCPGFWADAEAGHLAGAVILTTKSTSAFGERLHACPIPMVGDKTEFSAILDTAGIITAAVRRLAAHGCRRLGLLSWRTVEPFRRAVKECGLATDDAWIRSDLNPAVRGAGWDEFREIWGAGGQKPDGLVILDDMLYHDAQMAMFELGVRVPGDLHLVVQTSRGASPPSRLPVDAIEVDPVELASALADLLGRRLGGEPLAPVTRILSYREVRAESGAAKARRVARAARG
jgi:DNA-binding LacI/PurR family transcriptional regulator